MLKTEILITAYKQMKIRHKTIISYLLVLLIPVTAIGLVSSIYSAKVLKDSTIKLTLNVVDQINCNIEYNFKDINALSSNLYTHKNGNIALTDYLEGDPPKSQLDKISIKNQFSSYFYELSNSRSDLSAVYIYGNNGMEYYYYQRKIGNAGYSPNDDWYKQSIKNTDKTTILGIHKQFYNKHGIDVFSVSRKIMDHNMKKYIAVVLVDFELQSLRRICKSTGLNMGETIIICDGEGNTIYNTDETKLYDKVDSALLDKTKDKSINVINCTFNNQESLLISSPSDGPNLKILFLIPQNKILQQSKLVTKIILAISLLSLLFALFLSNYFSSLITRPLQNLSTFMKLADSGNLNIHAKVENCDEIGELTKSFNAMIYKIKTLIDNEYKLGIARKEAELKALIAQINPHFIYNTLEIISGAAIEYKVPMIKQISTALGQMLRYSIKTGNDIVLLEQEIGHLRNYLEIFKYRFDDDLCVVFNIADECRKCKVLKLILQPLVENSIKHGLQNITQRKGIIKIEVSRNEDILNIEISDNGIGMSSDELQRINKALSEDYESSLWKMNEKNSIGLRNVNARLCLYYGESFKLNIESSFDVGTTIFIKIPIKMDGDELDKIIGC